MHTNAQIGSTLAARLIELLGDIQPRYTERNAYWMLEQVRNMVLKEREAEERDEKL